MFGFAAEVPTGPASVEDLVVALGILGASIAIGLFAGMIILPSVARAFPPGSWRLNEITPQALKGMTVLWGAMAGVRFAAGGLPLTDGFQHGVDTGLRVALVLSLTLVLSRLISALIRNATASVDGHFPISSIFINVSKVGVFIVGGLMVLGTLNVPIAPILTAFGVGGLAVALALQGTLANFFAGIQIIAAKQLRPGDFIELDTGEMGTVHDVTWRTTTILGFSNNLIIVPNDKLASARITNHYQPDKVVAVRVPIGVHYDSDLDQVERVTVEVMKELTASVPGGIPEWEPIIRYEAFGDSSIAFTAVMRATDAQNGFVLRHEFIKRLKARYDKEGIEIPYPIRSVYVRSPAEAQALSSPSHGTQDLS